MAAASLGKTFLRLLLAGVGVAALLPTDAFAQIYRLPNPNPGDRDFFGVAVAIDGNRTVVGASGSDQCGESSGAAYVYDRDTSSGHWDHVATLSPDDCMEENFFGRSLSLSGDRVIVAAYRPTTSGVASNAAYIFELAPDSAWRQVARFTSDTGRLEGPYGGSVALNGDRAVVTAAGDAAGGAYHGAAYIYERDASGRWAQADRIAPDVNIEQGVFGASVDLDGETLVVTASTYVNSDPGTLYVFENGDSGWREVQRFRGLYDFFLPVDLDGDRIIVGEREAGRREVGRASLFFRSESGRWRSLATINSNPPYEFGAFGTAVAMDGPRILVAGYDEQLRFEYNIDRVVYVFEEGDGGKTWTQRHIIDVGEVSFGSSIDIDSNVAAIGQASDGPPGAAFIVHLH